MRWIEACIETKSGEIDALCAALEALGIEGICIEDEADFQAFLENNKQYWDYVDESLSTYYSGKSRIKFYLPDEEKGQETLNAVHRALGKEITASYIDDADWENSWKENFPPLEIGKRLLVVPEWLKPEPGDRAVLRLEPGIGFGTGNHATTRMCLEALESMDLTGKKVLDLGCGSGILGLGALALGAAEVTGCDVDPKAQDAARGNAALNGIQKEHFQIYAGNVLTDDGLRKRLGGGYDVVLANIVADVIISLCKYFRTYLAPEGILICSGIIDERASEIETELEKNQFRQLCHLHEEEWHCYILKNLR